MFQVSRARAIKIAAFIIAATAVSFSLSYIASAWTEPASAPPNSNVSAPVNISGTQQNKAGALSVTTLYDYSDPTYYIDPSAGANLGGSVNINGVFKSETAAGTWNWLEINRGGDKIFFGSDSANRGIWSEGTRDVSISTNGANRLVVNGSSGNVGIGTVSPATNLEIAGDSNRNQRIITYSGAGGGAASDDRSALFLARARGTMASPAVITSGDTLGKLVFSGYNTGGSVQPAAAINAYSTGTIGSNIPSVLTFLTSNETNFLTEKMRIDKSGNVGIGITNPQNRLHIAGEVSIDGWDSQLRQGYYTGNGSPYLRRSIGGAHGWDPLRLYINGWNDWSNGVSIGGPGGNSNFYVTGNATAQAFFYSSDERLKENITKIENPLEKILKLNGVSFNWKNSGGKSIGLTAQNVEKVFPELVSTDTAGMKSVEYGNLVAPLIEAIKEQQKMIENQQKEIDALKALIK